MPDSYYGFEGGVDWARVFACLLIQDGLQYFMHRCEHRISKAFYRASHEPHHQFTNPRLFDAFNGSFADTCFMIARGRVRRGSRVVSASAPREDSAPKTLGT